MSNCLYRLQGYFESFISRCPEFATCENRQEACKTNGKYAECGTFKKKRKERKAK